MTTKQLIIILFIAYISIKGAVVVPLVFKAIRERLQNRAGDKDTTP